MLCLPAKAGDGQMSAAGSVVLVFDRSTVISALIGAASDVEGVSVRVIRIVGTDAIEP
jgi:hypothetical protein